MRAAASGARQGDLAALRGRLARLTGPELDAVFTQLSDDELAALYRS